MKIRFEALTTYPSTVLNGLKCMGVESKGRAFGSARAKAKKRRKTFQMTGERLLQRQK